MTKFAFWTKAQSLVLFSFFFSFGLSNNDYFLAWMLVFLYIILPAFDSELFEILIYGVEFFSNNFYNNSLRPPNYLLTYIPLIRVTHQPLELVSGKLSGLHDAHPSLSTARKEKMCKTKALHHVFIQHTKL